MVLYYDKLIVLFIGPLRSTKFSDCVSISQEVNLRIIDK